MSLFPLRPGEVTESELIASRAVHVLAERGAAGLTLAAVARLFNETPSALHQQFGGRAPFLVRMTRTIADAFGRWTIGDQLVRIPQDHDERVVVRAWVALGEVARTEYLAGRPDCASILAEAWEAESFMVRRRLERRVGGRVDPDDVTLVLAAGSCLRERVAALVDPMAPERATALLDRLARTARVVGDLPPEPRMY